MKLRFSLLSVALALCLPAVVAAQTPTVWVSPVKVAASDGALTKISGCDGCADAGAHSRDTLTGDGYVQFLPAPGYVMFAGLGSDLSASTAYTTIAYAFELHQTDTWEVRELGVYRTDGVFAPGDVFRVGVESGVVVYRHNGAVVYTSTIAPSAPLGFDVSLLSAGASLSQAVIATSVASTGGGGTTTTSTGTTTTTSTGTSAGGPVRVPVGPYTAVVDRNVYPKPAVPVLGPAGSAIVDPTFGSRILRVTDGFTRPGMPGRSYRSPSSPNQNAWSANGSYFYVSSDDGTIIPFAFDAAHGTAQRIDPTTTGAGGLIVTFYIEPQFSYVNDSLMYGSYSGPGSTLHTVDQFDLSTRTYTQLLNLESIVGGLAGTYIGGVSSSAGPTERLLTFFGGTAQDQHHYALVFDHSNPGAYQMVDTLTPTLNFHLHHANIDRSGRYVMLYTTAADQAAPRSAPQSYLWDTTTGTITPMGPATHPYGHDTFGYGVSVNMDCCTTSAYDAAQWQERQLTNPLVSRDIIATVLTPKEVQLSDHPTWHNARPDQMTPFISGLFRYGLNTTPWRAWDDEIVAIQTDAAPGADPTVWRFAHHRSNVTSDIDPAATGFWYQPRPNVSHDGRWVMFTSNWEKSLGADPAGDAATGARQDIFVVALASGSASSLAVATTPLASGRVAQPYSAQLQASGGTGTVSWAVAGGSLPAGLSLDPAAGAIAGTPTTPGTATFTVTVSDAGASKTASGTFSITVADARVAITTGTVPGGRLATPYSTMLQATGGYPGVKWAISAGALPLGLTLDPASGAISGTPMAATTAAFTVTATDASDATNTASAPLTITITSGPVAIASAQLSAGRVAVSYTGGFQATGGSGSYSWWVASGALPAGLSLNQATGAIGGIPTAPGTSTFQVSVSAAGNPANTASASGTIVIAAGGVQVTTAALPIGRAGLTYAATDSAFGGSGTFVWSAAGLPAGVAINGATGFVNGVPTTAGSYSVTIRAADAADATDVSSKVFTLTVSAGVRITSPRTIPPGSVNTPYSYAVETANGVGTLKFGLAGGALPPGITLNGATGVISGACPTPGTYYFNVRVKDASTNDTLTLGLTIK